MFPASAATVTVLCTFSSPGTDGASLYLLGFMGIQPQTLTGCLYSLKNQSVAKLQRIERGLCFSNEQKDFFFCHGACV